PPPYDLLIRQTKKPPDLGGCQLRLGVGHPVIGAPGVEHDPNLRPAQRPGDVGVITAIVDDLPERDLLVRLPIAPAQRALALRLPAHRLRSPGGGLRCPSPL